MRTLLLFCMLIITLSARENPFQPLLEGPDTIGKPVVPEERKMPNTALPEKRNGTEVVNFEHIRFLLGAEGIRIETKDELLKHFLLRKPTRFILDFKSDADFPTKKRSLSTAPFHEVRIGVHNGFYRVVLELNSTRRFGVEKFRYGYQLKVQ